jgi:hypothetical protein
LKEKDWLSSINSEDLLIIEIGAGTIIKNVRLEAKRIGAPIIRINPSDSKVSMGAPITCGALEALIKLDSLLEKCD